MTITIPRAYITTTMQNGLPSAGHFLAHMVNPRNNVDPRLLMLAARLLAYYRALGLSAPLSFTFSPR